MELSDADKQAGKNTLWEQWRGLVQRRCPKTLVLVKLSPAITVPRAPGPGAMRKVDWKPLARKHLHNRHVVLHSDSARSYRMKVPGMVHNGVIYKKKRVKRGGKWIWLKPTYVKVSTHKLPDGSKIQTKAGAQNIDRAWRFIPHIIVWGSYFWGCSRRRPTDRPTDRPTSSSLRAPPRSSSLLLLHTH